MLDSSDSSYVHTSLSPVLYSSVDASLSPGSYNSMWLQIATIPANTFKISNMHLAISKPLHPRFTNIVERCWDWEWGTNFSVQKPRLILNNLPVIGIYISIFALFAHVLWISWYLVFVFYVNITSQKKRKENQLCGVYLWLLLELGMQVSWLLRTLRPDSPSICNSIY